MQSDDKKAISDYESRVGKKYSKPCPADVKQFQIFNRQIRKQYCHNHATGL